MHSLNIPISLGEGGGAEKNYNRKVTVFYEIINEICIIFLILLQSIFSAHKNMIHILLITSPPLRRYINLKKNSYPK